MDKKTILILGGYGNTGRCLARLLLEETPVRLVLAGRSLKKAQGAAAELNRDFEGGRVQAVQADAGDPETLKAAFTGVHMVIVAAPVADHVREVAAAALTGGADYLDLMYPQKKVPLLQSLAGEITAAGRVFITEAGFHPGLPAALVRHGAAHFDRLDEAIVSSVINQSNWPLTDSFYELVEEFKDYQALIFREGKWQQVAMGGMMDAREADFGPEFGRRYTFPMNLTELRPLPEMFPSLKDTGFYIAGFNWFTDWLVFPLMLPALRLFRRRAVKPLGRLLHWGIKTFSSPPYGCVIKIEATGYKDGKPARLEVRLSHADGYQLTAIPVAACLKQYLNGSFTNPGLYLMGHLTDPHRLLKDMEGMGVKVEIFGGGG